MANENGQEKCEALADIVAEMRNWDNYSHLDNYAHEAIIQYADRIEAAWKRDEERAVEHATRHAESVARDNCRDCVHNPNGKNYAPVGNAAAMREALVAVVKAFDDALICTDSQMSMEECDRLDEVYHKVNAALSAPPRQCDVGTAEEQYERFRVFCNKGQMPQFAETAYCAHECSCRDAVDCKFAWAQTPYEAQEGAGE